MSDMWQKSIVSRPLDAYVEGNRRAISSLREVVATAAKIGDTGLQEEMMRHLGGVLAGLEDATDAVNRFLSELAPPPRFLH